MGKVTKDNPYRKALIDLILSINRIVPLEEPDRVLLLIQLDTEEKIMVFNNWVKSKADGETLNTTAIEIMNQAAKIGRGKF